MTNAKAKPKPDQPASDPLNPNFYQAGKYRVDEFIAAFKLSFARGCIVKYAVRAGRKSQETELLDLQKARNFINAEIARLEAK